MAAGQGEGTRAPFGGRGVRHVHIHLPQGMAFSRGGRIHVVTTPSASPSLPDGASEARKRQEETLRVELALKDPPKIEYNKPNRSLAVTWKSCDAANPTYTVTMTQGESKTVYSGSETRCEVGGVKPGRTYAFRVAACSGEITGEPSPEPGGMVEVPAEPPAKPRPLRIVTKSKSAVTFSWQVPESNGDPVSNFCLEWNQGKSEGEFQQIYCGPDTQFKFTKKLESGHRYLFRMKAINTIGESEYGEVKAVVSELAVPPKATPPVVDSVDTHCVQLSWEPSASHDSHMTGSISFKLEMEDPDSGHGFRVVYQGEGRACRQDSLARNHLYRFQISMANEKGTGIHSNPIEVRTLSAPPTAPGPPTLQSPPKKRGLSLGWDPPADDGGSPITSYTLEMAAKGEPFKCVYEGAESKYDCVGLTPGMLYQFRVRSVSLGGIGQWSQPVSYGTCPEPPRPPLELRVSGRVHQTKAGLQWNPPTFDGGAPAIHYTVEYAAGEGSGAWSVGGVVPAGAFRSPVDPPPACTHLLSGLSPGHSYRARVGCSNSAGASPWSNVVMVTTAPGVPGPPVLGEPVVKSPSSVLVSWEVPPAQGSDIIRYLVQYKMAEQQWREMPAPGPSCLIKTLLPDREYHYRVAAVNSVGQGVWSCDGQLHTPPSVPGQVTKVTVVSQHCHELSIAWETPIANGSDILSYQIETGNGSVDVLGTCNTHTITDLAANTQCRVRVLAVNAIGAGPPSSYTSAHTLAPPPAPPTLTVVSATPSTLKLSWSRSGKKLSHLTYCLQQSCDQGGHKEVYSGGGVVHRVSRLAPDSAHSFRVRAEGLAGPGEWSPLVSFRTRPLPPDTPTELAVEVLSAEEVLCTWNHSDSHSNFQYELQMSNGSGDGAYKQVYCGSARRATVECLGGKSFQLRARAVAREPLVYGGFTDPLQFEIPEQDQSKPSCTEVVPPGDCPNNSDTKAPSQPALNKLTHYSLHLVFILLSVLVVMGAFLLGYFLDF